MEAAKIRDQKLLEFYERKNATAWAIFIRIRLGFLESELSEL